MRARAASRPNPCVRGREQIHSTIIQQARDGIVLVDAYTLRFVEFNEAAHNQLGFWQEFLAMTLRTNSG